MGFSGHVNKDFLNVRVYNNLDTQNIWTQENAHIGGDLSVTRNFTVNGDTILTGTLVAPSLDTSNITIDTIRKNAVTVAWPSTAGAAGSILTNDGAGNLNFTLPAAGGNVSTATSFDSNNRLMTTDTPNGINYIKQTNVSLDGTDNITGVNTLTANTVSAPSLDGTATNVTNVNSKTAVAVASATQVIEDATNTLTPSTLVLRDASNNFDAGTITANITGNVSGSAGTAGYATSSGSAVNFSGSLTGDVSGSQGATVVNNVGGSAASAVNAGTILANQATDSNTASRIVRRDGSGDFDAGLITASFSGPLSGDVTGNVTGSLFGNADSATYAITSTNFTGQLDGDVKGPQDATVVTAVSGKSADYIATGATLAQEATASDVDNTIVRRDGSGNFATNMITLNGTIDNAKHATTKEYVDSLAATGLTPKTPALVVSLVNTVTGGTTTIDSVPLSVDNRVLLVNQDYEIDNGLWLVQDEYWTRPDDFANDTEAGQAYVLTTSGLTQAGSSWLCNTPLSTIGTNTLTFVQFTTPGQTIGNNVGTGVGNIYRDKTGIVLNFKTLAEGAFIKIDNGSNDLTITASATSENIPNTLVARDSEGNFIAGTMTGFLTGAASLNVLRSEDTITNALQLEDTGAQTILIKAPTSLASSYTIILPSSGPATGQYLRATTPTSTDWHDIDALPSVNKVFYVTLAGDDSTGNGSLSNPYLTVKKALSEANAVASPSNPVMIDVSAGIFVENNSGGPLEILADNISIIGDSLLSTVIMPSSVTDNLFTITATNVEIYNLELRSENGSTASAITLTADDPGKYCFKNILTTNFKRGFDLNSATYLPTIFLDNTRFFDNETGIAINNANISLNNGHFVGSSSSTPDNTAIYTTGPNASVSIFNTIVSTCTTGLEITGGAHQSILSSEFENTHNCLICSGASTTEITGCNFFRNPDGAINIAASVADTRVTAESCNFYCADYGSHKGTVFKVTNAAEIVATSHIIRNAETALECGTTGDTNTTVLKAGSVFLIETTTDIKQTGSSLLRFISGAFYANKVIIENPTYVSIASYERESEFGNITMSIGNAKDVSQQIYEVFQGPNDHYPHISYEPDYYGTKGTIYKNPQGTPTFNGTEAFGNNAYSYVITSSRDKETGIKLLSDTSSTVGDWNNIRGWSISKLGDSADLAFTYTDNDQALEINKRGPYTLMQLDGTNNEIDFPLAATNPVGTTAKLIWGTDTNLYRDSANTLKTDDSLVVGTLAPTAGIVHNDTTGLLSSSLIINADIDSSAAIADTKLAVISAAGKVLDSATTATSYNIFDTIVKRDTSGDFAANMITSSLTGMVTGTASFNVLKIGDTMTGTLTHPAGTSANPSIQFSGSTNTGFSAATADRLSVDVQGVEKMSIDATTVQTTTTFISAAASILAKEVCLGGFQVDATNNTSVTVNPGTSTLLKIPTSDFTYNITMPANPINGQLLTIILGANRNIALTYTGATIFYEVDRLRPLTNFDANSNGQSVTYIYHEGTSTWYRYSRG